jgi:hypothetical protein
MPDLSPHRAAIRLSDLFSKQSIELQGWAQSSAHLVVVLYLQQCTLLQLRADFECFIKDLCAVDLK